jgi:long-subunit fatty acid transport protein
LSAVVNLNLGAEFRLPFTGLSARAGAIYQPSPYHGDTSRYDQKFLTAGIGINSGGVMQFDMAYAYGWRGEHKSQQEVSGSGTEQTIAYHTALFTMRFAP